VIKTLILEKVEEVKITYGKADASTAPGGKESRKARAEYRSRTGGGSFQHGDPASDLKKITGGNSGSPRDVKDHGK
jgi:hypothetical protein